MSGAKPAECPVSHLRNCEVSGFAPAKCAKCEMSSRKGGRRHGVRSQRRKNDVPDGDIRGHWYLDLEPEDEDFETHWRVKSTGKKIEKDKALLVSTQTGFEMIRDPDVLIASLCWADNAACETE